MLNVSSIIKLNFKVIEELDVNALKALEKTTDELLSEVKNAQIMPYDTSRLQETDTFADYSDINKGYARIVSDTPYARRLYFHPEYNFSKKEHAFAGGKWYAPWLEGGTRENFCEQTFAEFYRRLCNL